MKTKNETQKNDLNATIGNTVLSAVFIDINGNELKKGDKINNTIFPTSAKR